MTIEKTLTEREGRYGAFADHARLSQHLTDVMRAAPKWEDLSAVQKEALEMIQHKVARILNGDPCYGDNWHDIAGYATLVEQNLEPTLAWPEVGAFEDLAETTDHYPLPMSDRIVSSRTGRVAHWVCGCRIGHHIPAGEACPVCFSTK